MHTLCCDEQALCSEQACPALGSAAAPKPITAECLANGIPQYWGRFAAQRRASLLTTTSPLTIAATSSCVIASRAQLDGIGWYFHLPGFLMGSFSAQLLYALGGATIRRMRVENPDFILLNRTSGVCLIGFAAWQMYRLLRHETV